MILGPATKWLHDLAQSNIESVTRKGQGPDIYASLEDGFAGLSRLGSVHRTVHMPVFQLYLSHEARSRTATLTTRTIVNHLVSKQITLDTKMAMTDRTLVSTAAGWVPIFIVPLILHWYGRELSLTCKALVASVCL